MSNTKTQLRFFSVPEWQKEENYLREQHKNGWAFIRVSGLGVYHFEKCVPQDVVYQLDYNADSTKQPNEYIQLFRDCGWEYLQNYAGYSYFRKAASEMGETEEGIFCDDASRLDMMKRVFVGRMTPLLIVFFSLIIPQMFLQSHSQFPESRAVFIFYCVLFAVYVIAFIQFGVRYWKFYRSVHK